MNRKQLALQELRSVLQGWQQFLSTLRPNQRDMPLAAGEMSIKDTIAHLWSWQLVSLARLDAAVGGHAPQFPAWLRGLEPEDEDNIHRYNHWITEASQDRTWEEVHQAWQAGFYRLLTVAEQIPERDLVTPGRYDWLPDSPLIAVLEGTLEHHREHLDHAVDHLAASSH